MLLFVLPPLLKNNFFNFEEINRKLRQKIRNDVLYGIEVFISQNNGILVIKF